MNTSSTDATAEIHRDLHRPSKGRILGGVAVGLARSLDIDVAIVRVGMSPCASLPGWPSPCTSPDG